MVFELRLIPPSVQFSETKIPFQTGTTKTTGFFLPPAPSQKAYFPGGAGHQHFSSYPQLLAEAKFSASAVERWALPSCPPDLTYRMETLLGVRATENTETLISLLPAHKALLPFHLVRGEMITS